MNYASKYPRYKLKTGASEVDRPIKEIVNILLMCMSVSYKTTRDEYKVSSETGQLVERK